VYRDRKVVEYDNFFEVITDEEVDETIRLGLKKFVIK
jgi:hypothetical protein